MLIIGWYGIDNMEDKKSKLDMYERFSGAIAILVLIPAILHHGLIMGCVRAFLILFTLLLMRKLFYWVVSGDE